MTHSNLNEKEPMEAPPGFTPEQLARLSAWAEADHGAPGAGEEWLQRVWLETAIQAMSTEVPRLATQWLPACLGLIRLAGQGGYLDLRAEAQVAAGKLCWVCARYQDALELFEQARTAFETLNDRIQTAVCYRSAGAVYHQMALPSEAREMYRQARALFEEQGDRRNAAICYFNTGLVDFQTGHPDEALKMYGQAHSLFEQVEDSQSAAVCLLNTGIVYADLGRAAESFTMYERALTVFEGLGDRRRTATCLHQSGLLYSRMGHLPEALVMYDKARALFEELGDRRRVALCFLNAANHVYSQQGHFAHARAMYERARPIFEELQDRRGVAGCHLSAGDALLLEGRLPEAQALYEQARTLFEAIEDKVSLAHCYSSEGEAWMRMGELERAEKLYENAYRLLEPSGDVRSLILCHQRWGDLYQHTGSYEQAAQHYEQALSLLESLRDALPDAEMAAGAAFNLEHLPASLASILILLKRPKDAFEAAQRAKGALLRYAALGMRAKRETLLPDEQARLQHLRTVYEQKREALGATPTHSPEYRQLYREMETALAELNAYEMAQRVKKGWEDGKTGKRGGKAIRNRNSPQSEFLSGKAILEILVSRHHLCLFLLKTHRGRSRLKARLVEVDLELLKNWMSRWFEDMRSSSKSPSSPELSQPLYQLLIKPFETELNGVETLIICPDHCLHALPFGALLNEQGDYLIECFNLCVAPSASAWEACHQAGERLRSEPSATPLIVAVSQFGRSPSSSTAMAALTDLPHAREEAEIVYALVNRQAHLLIDEEASVEEVRQRMPQAGLLHFATHASPNETAPLLGALALAAGDSGGASLLYARDIYEMELKASLTVLSACSTAQGRIAGGEGLIGLAWAFLMAGCPSVIATRWEAQDEAARLWVECFYRAYVAGCSKAESARRACMHLIKQPAFSAPHFWAGWTLIGNDV